MEKSENRAMERFSLQLLARVSLLGEEQDQEAIELLTRNVSAGGAFFETDHPLPVGTKLKIELILPLKKIKKVKGEKALVRIIGSIVRTESKGMAMSFDKDYQIVPLKS